MRHYQLSGDGLEGGLSNRVGIFGGTFDPIHLGHAALAQSVYIDFKLDELILMPAKLPPHKTSTGATPAQRYEMARLTAAVLRGNISVSDFELNEPSISYTYLTLKHHRDKNPDDILFFICGSDIFQSIGSWQNWRELFTLSNFVVVNREVSFESLMHTLPEELLTRVIRPSEYNGETAGRIIFYEMDPVRISSTQIRGRMAVRCGELLTEDVYEYIVKNNLYMGAL